MEIRTRVGRIKGALVTAKVAGVTGLLCGGLVVVWPFAGCGGKAELAPTSEAVAPGYCAKACSVTTDCCPGHEMSCLGAYPRNFSCEQGLCRAPRCENDADCSFLVGDAGAASLVCRTLGGHPGCMLACVVDADCGAIGGLSGGTCSGQADDGTRICVNQTGLPAKGCTVDADCPAGKHCQSGVCGCAADAECKPTLDVCTTDRDFAYPSSAAAAPGSGGSVNP